MAAGDTIAQDGQIEWAGTLLGATTAYRWLELTGWEDLPGLDSGSVLRPVRHGAWPGRRYAQERVVTWTATISLPSALATDFSAAVTAIRRATAVASDETELPLVIRTKGGETLLCYAAVTTRIIPNNPQAGVGRGQLSLQWTASDPRRYGLVERSATIPQPVAGTGLVYPLVYPLVYGTAAESGARTLTNAGDVATNPVLTVTGPCTTPVVANLTTGRQLEVAVIVAAGEQLVIDTDAGTALLGGADRQGSLTENSVPIEDFELADGDNDLAFRATTFTTGASCAVTWRDAYL